MGALLVHDSQFAQGALRCELDVLQADVDASSGVRRRLMERRCFAFPVSLQLPGSLAAPCQCRVVQVRPSLWPSRSRL